MSTRCGRGRSPRQSDRGRDHLVRPSAPAPETSWNQRFAQRTQRITASMIRELLKLTEKPDIISFAGGLPAPEVFPVEEIRAATDRVLREHGTTALQYTTTEGYRPLRELLVRHMGRYGVDGEARERARSRPARSRRSISSGKLLINPGDRVLTEAPTYLGRAPGLQRLPGRLPPGTDRRRGSRRRRPRETAARRPEVPVRAAELPESRPASR